MEYDLLERLGLDIRDCFGGGLDWRTVWRLKDRLPRESHYKTAVAMDEQLAETAAAQPEPDADDYEPPTPLGYTLEAYLLLTIIDCLQGVQAAVIASTGTKPPALQPMPRPQTALDRVREQRWRDRMQALVDLFAPHEHTDP
ncbi:hypothetical protein [Nocardia transvalensis]|uniref:hypothetical protein n=1 Tax=Nocardia transvalensis TaxID=37333 RepID=UPI001894919D|nr:hypothetical protein [Nocardia transvalensis]MBF6332373.1 hypothetical protein [Nocardia transvalensis]